MADDRLGGTHRVIIPPGVAASMLDYFERLNRGKIGAAPNFDVGAQTMWRKAPAYTGQAAQPIAAMDLRSQSAAPSPQSGPESIALPQVYERGPASPYDEAHKITVAHSAIGSTGKVETEKYQPYYGYGPVSQKSFDIHEATHKAYLEKNFPANPVGGLMAGADSRQHNDERELPAYDAQMNFLQDYLEKHGDNTPGWHAVFKTYMQIGKEREEVEAKVAERQKDEGRRPK